MSLDQNKAIARRHFEELWGQGDLSVADEIYDPSCVGHCANAPEQTGYPESEKQHVLRDRAVSRDGEVTVEDQLAEGDKVLTRWVFRGTHTEPLPGIPPTGNRITLHGMHVHRIVDGKIVEVWAIDTSSGSCKPLALFPPV